MRIGVWAGIGMAGLVLGGCSRGPSFVTDPGDPAALAAARTVALAAGEPAVVLSDTYREVPAPAFAEAVLGLLPPRGLARTEPGAADLWLRAHLLVPRAGGGRARGRSGGGRRGGAGGEGGGRGPGGNGRRGGGPEGGGVPPEGPQEVQIVLELVGRATGARVWTGSATATLDVAPGTPEGQRALADLAARLLASVRGGAAPR
ncbi:hypothetical protein GETHPA_23340 [Geothrix rubra]|uniref:DUF4136 domain-containing protein n=1 Tax=Geothrix rubra TaxID=2927977 RepID=A0ABQ5Q8K7_9BACT|nr:hypothetical protein [Geothrix rubra]GLH70801.1 hypothetical protein GETHPA_23340 [Geothrix rubra]